MAINRAGFWGAAEVGEERPPSTRIREGMGGFFGGFSLRG
jgi:hypothetical protein